MNKFINLNNIPLETNSSLWQVLSIESEFIIQIVDNIEIDHLGGKVALINSAKTDYSMEAEFKFLGHHLPREKGGWFGFVIRAQDTDNYELIWFMPTAESGKTVAYISVAHGIVPWWSEAYASQKKGYAFIPKNDWFKARVDIKDNEITVFVNDEMIFTKKIIYYLSEGRPGLYVGTGTDASFRRIMIKDL